MKDLLLCVHLNFGNFTLSFFRLRQRIVLKCVLHVQHVQHDYFSSFNQSDRLFSGVVVAIPVVLAEAPYSVISLKCNLPKGPFTQAIFAAATRCKILSQQNRIRFQTCSKPLRYRGDKSHLVYTCDFEAATLPRQKSHRVAATKIACVNGP